MFTSASGEKISASYCACFHHVLAYRSFMKAACWALSAANGEVLIFEKAELGSCGSPI